MRKQLLFLATALAVILFAPCAFAQVMIEQGKVVIKANPGETVVDTLTIHNTSKTDTLVLRVYWEDFMYVTPYDGTKEFAAAGTSERSLSKWVNFSPQQFTIEPYGVKKISYSIQVPASAKGGYYGVLFVESSGDKVKDRLGVTIVTRMGSLFFVETTNSTHKGKIENRKYADKNFEGDFTNLGDVVLIPDATYYILGKDGLVAERGEIKKFYLAAGKTTTFKVPAGEKLKAGEYTAILTFDFGDGENLTDEFDFTKTADGSISIIPKEEKSATP